MMWYLDVSENGDFSPCGMAIFNGGQDFLQWMQQHGDHFWVCWVRDSAKTLIEGSYLHETTMEEATVWQMLSPLNLSTKPVHQTMIVFLGETWAN